MFDIVQVTTLWCTHRSVDQISRKAKSLNAAIAVKNSQCSLSCQTGLNLKPMFGDIDIKISGDEDVVLVTTCEPHKNCTRDCIAAHSVLN